MKNTDPSESSDYLRFIEEFAEHMPIEDGHRDLCILKGHLLIERSLNGLLEAKLTKPECLDKADLKFSQKLLFAESIGVEDQDYNWIWKAIEKLNKIRNKLAHNLEDPGLDDRITDFIAYVERSVHYPLQEDDKKTLGDLNTAILNVYHAIWFCI